MTPSAHPHTALKHLPVAETAPVLDRLVRMVAAVRPQDAEEVRALADRLLAEDGPALREALVARAEAEDAAGRNWMSVPWLQGYLAERRPLPLSTNVVFQVGLGRDQPGGAVEDSFERAADVIRRAAAVHLTEARGETEPPVDARGSAIDPAQFACLNGGLREPGSPVDAFRAAGPGAARREVGLFVRGRLFAVPLTHDDGRLLGRAELASAVARVAEEARGGAGERGGGDDGASGGVGSCGIGGGVGRGEPAFGALSALGSAHLAELLPALLQDEANVAVSDRLRQMLFTVSLLDGETGTGTGRGVGEEGNGDGADGGPGAVAGQDAAALLQGLTDPSLAWVYRPISYLHRLTDGWTAMHVEHSTVDGATLVEAVCRMQQVTVEETSQEARPAPCPAAEVSGQAGETDVVGKELAWTWPEQLRERATTLLDEAAERAAELRVDMVRTRRPDVQAAGMKVSLDAVQQLVMALAQRIAFGRVRGHYESVDMREYQAGRTECLRPVTPELVALVEALAAGPVEGRAAVQWRELLVAALDAHRDWVKACKAGHGVDRHLFGLGLAAEAVQERSEALDELTGHPAVRQAREDFLSTTSIGSADQVVRYAFVPSVEDGFGVAYTPAEDWLEFTVSHWAGGAAEPERFLAALERAAERVDELLQAVGRVA
ncbi:choline/carnitine O-acyltransferase [Micrococcus lylae]|uniref:choline/carnitine O-acyltransferase n=1 Tax=Micrococcus lylae TaxID=1273 RepID=UPI000C803D03|nr:choline/carnitine O-acyltransferase [Micrococcus lylae]WIK81781.1 choline/carnitine O-acyltransferase [Micrococcus lylae]